mmetsp:Transcript_945/g.2018  ORF Transcript_945/g.2018 Transcript_945/m.2018 type:complete len:348 (+) Transcript_945:188-1231(+)
MMCCNTRVSKGTVALALLLVLTTLSAPAAGIDDTDGQVCANKNEDGSEGGSCSPLSGRTPPRIYTNESFRDLEGLTSFEPITTISYDDILDRVPSNDDHNNNKLPNAKIAAIPGGEAIDLKYVKDIVSPEIAAQLIHSCDQRSGWTTSPQSVGGSAQVKASRTSRSCPLIWPQLYLPLLDNPDYASRLTPIRDEINLTWRLTQRVAEFLGVGEEYIEPFQLVRYQPGEFYKEHHDHGSYYGANTEQRPWTLLIFLSDVPSSSGKEGGGYTKFRALGNDGGVSVVPRLGDGVLWRNEDERTGELLLDAVHEAIPPKDNNDNVIKYAMNVWIAKKKIRDNMDVSAYRTH